MDRENRKFLKKLSVCVAVLFVIATVVSLCVMNFTPINRLLGGYKEQPLDLSRADGANITYNDDGTITLGEGYSEIEFTGIDARVGSIGFDVDFGESANRARSMSISPIQRAHITARISQSSRSKTGSTMS